MAFRLDAPDLSFCNMFFVHFIMTWLNFACDEGFLMRTVQSGNIVHLR